jgi:hypothetical protein
MRLTTTAYSHDLLAVERFLAAEARIAGTFGRIEEAVAPVLRAMRATGRTTYATDPERGAVWGHAFLRPPYAPDAAAEWFLAWGLRFPDGGTGWDGADPPLPRGVHAVVALGAGGEPQRRPHSLPRARLPRGWSALDGEAAFLAVDRASAGLATLRKRPRMARSHIRDQARRSDGEDPDRRKEEAGEARGARRGKGRQGPGRSAGAP